jgi:hypothetical protein
MAEQNEHWSTILVELDLSYAEMEGLRGPEAIERISIEHRHAGQDDHEWSQWVDFRIIGPDGTPGEWKPKRDG